MPDFRAARRWAAPTLLGLVGALWLVGFAYWLSQLEEIVLGDFTTYWVGARNVIAGQPLYPDWQLDSVYRLGFASNGRGYVYPPTSAVLTAPLGLVPLNVAWSLVTVISIAALVAVVAAVARQNGLSPRISAALGLAFAASPPALESLTTGNANTQVALAMLAMWLLPKVAGYVAIVGALVKLYPAVAITWVVRKRTSILGPVAVGVVLVVVSVVWLGAGAWRDFVTVTMHARPGSDFLIPSIRAGLATQVAPGVADAIAYGVTIGLALAVLRVRSDQLAFFLLSLAMVAPAPDWYLHYMIVPLAGAVPLVASTLSRVTGAAEMSAERAPVLDDPSHAWPAVELAHKP